MIAPEPTQARRNRVKLLLLVVIFAAPVLLATGLHLFIEPSRFRGVEHGQLIKPPLRIADLATDQSSSLFLASLPSGVWVMLYPSFSGCGSTCLEALYSLRQVKSALGEKSLRVKAMLLAAAGDPAIVAASARDSGLVIADLSVAEFTQWKAALEPHHKHGEALLIDPLGNLFMRVSSFDKGLLKDLQRLLRYSQIG